MQKKALWSLCVAAGSCACVWAANWPSVAGNPQRDGWAQQETHVSVANAKNIRLIYRHKFKAPAMGLNALTSTIDVAQVIGYNGFHEFLWTGSAAGTIFQNDADLEYDFKQVTLAPKEKVPAGTSILCPGGMTAAPILPGLSSVSRFGGGGGFGRLGLLWAVSADGYLNTLRQQDSNATWIAPQAFVPAGSNVSALNMSAENTVFATTIHGCGGTGNGVYATHFTIPVIANEPDKPFVSAPGWSPVVRFMTNGAGFAGAGGTAINLKGDLVFGTVPTGRGDIAGDYNDTVVALDGKTLTVKDYFTPTAKQPAMKDGVASAGVTPMVFTQGGTEYVVAGDRNGRIYLLDATALGGSDHHTPVFATEPVVAPDTGFAGNGIWGTFATQVDAEHGNTRYIYAAVHGPVSMKFPGTNGAAANGGIVAFKVDVSSGRAKLVPAWSSHDVMSPAGPITAGGLIFALSSGIPSRTARADGRPYTAAEVEKMSKPARLFVLDAATGAELYNGGPASSFSNTPLSFANGHVYFTTRDNTLFQYGIPEER